MSLTDSGVGVADADGKIVAHTSIKTKVSPVDFIRIDDIVKEFFEFVNPYLATNTVAFMFEDVIFGGRASGKSAARQQILGVIQWLLRNEGVRVVGMTPKAWVSHLIYPHKVPRSSDASKAAVKMVLENKFGFFTNNLNISDGCGLAIVGHAYYVQGKRLSVRALGRNG